MSDLIKTLKSSNTGDDVYPNIKEDNIPSGAVTSAKIGTSAVITGKINDGAVTTNKVSDGAITYEKLALALKNLIDGKASNYDLSIVQSALNTHIANTSNPHSVTKAQVGLGNVDNTSDANKPISTATQGALDLKADKSTTYTKTEVDTALSGKDNVTNNPFINDGDGWYLQKDTDEIHINPENFYLGLDATSASLEDVINNKQNKLYLHSLSLSIQGGQFTSDLTFYINVILNNNTPINSLALLVANLPIGKYPASPYYNETGIGGNMWVASLIRWVNSNDASDLELNYLDLDNNTPSMIDLSDGRINNVVITDTITTL